MCPVCITTAVLIAGSATSMGRLAAIAIRKFAVKNAADNTPFRHCPSCLEQRTEQEKSSRTQIKGEIRNVNEHDRESAS
jgi:hypothetical protein